MTQLQELMRRFCADVPRHPAMNHIAPWQDYYVACDGKHLLAVKQSACDFAPDYNEAEHGKYPNISAVLFLEKFRATHRIHLADLKAYISRIATEDEMEEYRVPTEYEDCVGCDGDGEIIIYGDTIHFRGRHFDMDQEVKCPICHGYGKVPKDPKYDPDICRDRYDVKGWITYANRPTGRKIISNNLVVYIDSPPLRASVLTDLLCVMETFGTHVADFQIVGYASPSDSLMPTSSSWVCTLTTPRQSSIFTMSAYQSPLSRMSAASATATANHFWNNYAYDTRRTYSQVHGSY